MHMGGRLETGTRLVKNGRVHLVKNGVFHSSALFAVYDIPHYVVYNFGNFTSA